MAHDLRSLCEKHRGVNVDQTGEPTVDCLYSRIRNTLNLEDNDILRLAAYGAKDEDIIALMVTLYPELPPGNIQRTPDGISLRLLMNAVIMLSEHQSKQELLIGTQQDSCPENYRVAKLDWYARTYAEIVEECCRPNPIIWKKVIDAKRNNALSFIPWKLWVSESVYNHKVNFLALDTNKTTPFLLQQDSNGNNQLVISNQLENVLTNNPVQISLATVLDIQQMRRIVYATESICTPQAAKLWDTMLKNAMQSNQLIAPGFRSLSLVEGEIADKQFWTSVFRTSYKENLTGDLAIRAVIQSAEVLFLLQPKPANIAAPVSVGDDAGVNHPEKKKRKPNSQSTQNHNTQPLYKAENGLMLQPPNPNSNRQKRLAKAAARNNNAQANSPGSMNINNSVIQTGKGQPKRLSKAEKKRRRREGGGNNSTPGASSSSLHPKAPAAAVLPNPQVLYQLPNESFHIVNVDDFPDNVIIIQDGSRIRPLRDGAGLCSPGTLHWDNRKVIPFWKDLFSLIKEATQGFVINPDSFISDISTYTSEKVLPAITGWLSMRAGRKISTEIPYPQCFRTDIFTTVARLAGDPDIDFIKTLDSGPTLGFLEPLTYCPEVFPNREKWKKYDPPREFVGNYLSTLDKADAIQAQVDKETSLGRMDGPLSKEELYQNYPNVRINALGAEIKDLLDPNRIRLLVDSTQAGVNQNIILTMQPTRPALADMMATLPLFSDPVGVKWDGVDAHRQIKVMPAEQALITLQVKEDHYYVNKVGTFGVSSAGQNWDRAASAVHRFALALCLRFPLFLFLFVDDTFMLCEKGDLPLVLPIIISFMMTLGYPLIQRKFWLNQYLIWVGFAIDLNNKVVGIAEVKRRFILEKLTEFLAAEGVPPLVDFKALAGSLNWAAQLAWPIRSFIAGLYAFEKSFPHAKNALPIELREELFIWLLFLQSPRFMRPCTDPPLPPRRFIITDACARSPFDDQQVMWESGMGIGGMLCEIVNGKAMIISWFACEIPFDLFPWSVAIKEPHRIINFLELIGTNVAARLWITGHSDPNELRWLDAIIITDNEGNSFIINNGFTSARPLAWALHELIAFALDKSIRFHALHWKGESSEISKIADQLSRGLMRLEDFPEASPDLYNNEFWYTDIRQKCPVNFREIMKLKDRKRIIKETRRTKGGMVAPVIPRQPKGLKAHRKRQKKMREMELSMEIDNELARAMIDDPVASLSRGGPKRADLDNACAKWATMGFSLSASSKDNPDVIK